MNQNFLLEIGVENFPPNFVNLALSQLKEKIEKLLLKNKISFKEVLSFGTPRRLVIYGSALAPFQENIVEEIKGPPSEFAYDKNGKPTPAASGFAKKYQAKEKELIIKEAQGKKYLFIHRERKGKPTVQILQEELPVIITSLSFPKQMRWGEKEPQFARPIRWLVCLLGRKTIKFKIGSLTAGSFSEGHQFLYPGKEKVTPSNYFSQMEKRGVIVDPKARSQKIKALLSRAAQRQQGKVLLDEELLERVVQLTEYPVCVTGKFPSEYLQLPREVVIACLREHQAFFACVDQQGNLKPVFFNILNIPCHGNVKKRIIEDNQRALEARLADAKFFWQEDLKKPLSDWGKQLKNVVWIENLGDLSQKTERLEKISQWLSFALKLSDEIQKIVKRVAALSKADMVTNMVREKEFTKLQGIIGGEYALRSGEEKEVALGIREHYLPRYPGDELPTSVGGTLVSIADKIDSLIGYFLKGLKPTSTQDPYGCRRLASGILEIFLKKDLKVNLEALIKYAGEEFFKNFPALRKEAILVEVIEFLWQRLRSLLLERNTREDVIKAVFATPEPFPGKRVKKINVLIEMLGKDKLRDIVTSFVRVNNILKNRSLPTQGDTSLFNEYEKALYQKYSEIEPSFSNSLREENYSDGLSLLSQFTPLINTFFEKVLIIAEDTKIRQNRLYLLSLVLNLYKKIADFSILNIE